MSNITYIVGILGLVSNKPCTPFSRAGFQGCDIQSLSGCQRAAFPCFRGKLLSITKQLNGAPRSIIRQYLKNTKMIFSLNSNECKDGTSLMLL